jgi:outer membrane protein TolC
MYWNTTLKIIKPLLAASICAVTLSAIPNSMAAPQAALIQPSLTQLVDVALKNDANRLALFAQSQAIREAGIASSSLPDPKIKFGVGGLPVDSLRFDDDGATNISVSLMQQFSRGDTLELQKTKAFQQADGMEWKIAARDLEVTNNMTQLWLELGFQQQAQQVLQNNLKLMREMVRDVETNYSLGKSETQDLINAQLQVTKLDEKIQANKQMQQRIITQLSEWLGSDWLKNQSSMTAQTTIDWRTLSRVLNLTESNNNYFATLSSHPIVKMADATIATNKTQVDIAKQAYTPEFGLEVMYGYRQANNVRGQPVSDLVSAYVTVDIPIFTENRQDRSHAAAQYQLVAAKSDKDLLLSQMNSKVNSLLIDRDNSSQRLDRYNQTLLPQAKARIKAVERGYQNNTAQFNDVITAASDELALELEKWRLVSDLQKTNSALAYLLNAFDAKSERPSIHLNQYQHVELSDQ